MAIFAFLFCHMMANFNPHFFAFHVYNKNTIKNLNPHFLASMYTCKFAMNFFFSLFFYENRSFLTMPNFAYKDDGISWFEPLAFFSSNFVCHSISHNKFIFQIVFWMFVIFFSMANLGFISHSQNWVVFCYSQNWAKLGLI